MKHIGLISDTHGYLDPKVFHYFEGCDEVWHAGDFGSEHLMEQIEAFRPTRAVFGNIDGGELRRKYPEHLFFECEGVKIYMTHIGGSPGKYSAKVKQNILSYQPQLFICGHSHILRVVSDNSLCKMLYLNPGAAGIHGFHKVRTLLRFKIDNGKYSDFQVIELGNRYVVGEGK